VNLIGDPNPSPNPNFRTSAFYQSPLKLTRKYLITFIYSKNPILKPPKIVHFAHKHRVKILGKFDRGPIRNSNLQSHLFIQQRGKTYLFISAGTLISQWTPTYSAQNNLSPGL
jgi:hypothetical protein